VRVQVVVPDRRYFVAVVDPIPGGIELVNTRFVTSATQRLGAHQTETTDTGLWWWWRHWRVWDHEEQRDDQARLFADQLDAGVYEYLYSARATTPGHYFIPPPRAEEMYAPETFGRGSSDILVVSP
jgi:hypothetical protein